MAVQLGGHIMGDAARFIDPFGAPEFFCNDMLLEQVAPGLVKVRMLAREPRGDVILRCTLLLPESVLASNIARTKEYMGEPHARVMAS